MKILIAEDDFITRRFLKIILSQYGECDIAINGNEAVFAFDLSLKENNLYDLVCLDIFMPGLDGQQALKQIREIESKAGIEGLDRVKVLIITALKDKENIIKAFNTGCEAYIVKPFDNESITKELKKIKLIK
jgi:two-component system chemotaxis response regulator CheY